MFNDILDMMSVLDVLHNILNILPNPSDDRFNTFDILPNPSDDRYYVLDVIPKELWIKIMTEYLNYKDHDRIFKL